MTKINGRTMVAGVIGNPIAHTLSPAIHNTLADLTGVDLVYVPFHVENVEQAMSGMRGLQLAGLNVTVPHKQAVIPYMDELNREAKLIGAVNTIVPSVGKLLGYNTDLPGLYRALCSESIEIEGQKVILLGAGGAARAAAYMLALHGAEKVWILNRSVDKAKAVAEEVNKALHRECMEALSIEAWKQIPQGKYLCVQATSVGLAPNTEQAVIEDPEFYSMINVGYDAVYRPADTKFMRLVREAGGRSCNGLKMLLYQGVEAYELWTGIRVSEEQAEACYRAMTEELYGGKQ